VKEVLNIFNNKTNIDGSIELGFDLIYNLSCACGKILQCARKLDQMKAIDFKCPSCGRLMEPAMTSTLDRSFSALLHKPLSHCCVPPLSLVTVRNGSSVLHLEFSGGKENILNFS
jgi:hypothetical protein